MLISNISRDGAKEHLSKIYNKSVEDLKVIRKRIDNNLKARTTLVSDALRAEDNIKSTFRKFIEAIENRGHSLLQLVEMNKTQQDTLLSIQQDQLQKLYATTNKTATDLSKFQYNFLIMISYFNKIYFTFNSQKAQLTRLIT